ncbi:MAG: SIS domain-containing protein [Actinobacteria bacterium]|nr:SIS domain-containing protein [Actinomycetota bacterium]MBW3649931.1 SIS domain-containing protein [Actinomycetota bacterium]
MCGIIAVLLQRSDRPVPERAALVAALEAAHSHLGPPDGSQSGELIARVTAAAAAVAEVDARLRGTPGMQALLEQEDLIGALEAPLRDLKTWIEDLEQALDIGQVLPEGPDLEVLNAVLLGLKDAIWAIEKDRLRTARELAALAGPGAGRAALTGYLSIQLALSALDRLEVRGRDSAGVHVLVEGHGLDLSRPEFAAEVAARADHLFTDGSVRAPAGRLSFVYKAAAEIGELGDNTAALRRRIGADALLRRALEADTAEVTVLGHTRWASVGIISQPNAHPLNSEEATFAENGGAAGGYLVAALNGDVDNYADLKTQENLSIAPEITTDAKVIPILVSRRMQEGLPLDEAFRETVSSFSGSVAIATSCAEEPGKLLLALRGSGQGLYIGIADEGFIVASEVYGLVEETSQYLRLDGEAPGGRDGRPGQIAVIDRCGTGSLQGIRRIAYDGTDLPLDQHDLVRAQITTRDIDRAGAPHFLLKEIGEAPQSIRKTLRGKLDEHRGLPAVRLPEGTLPAALLERLLSGKLRRIIVTGQGTAAVAAQAVAVALTDAFRGTDIVMEATTASELSGFGLSDDMSDTLVVAVSQSGTSTDTNRTVDLVRARGAVVVSIVNRRNSDLVDKSDGVLYTSDGRDVEMAVPSTKAFYAQIAAGVLLAWGLARAAGVGDRHRAGELLDALRRLPTAMEEVLARRGVIAAAAQRYAPPRRYWAVAGNGPNRVAAAELRIKLSELCYKSIACDSTEDKKHIDLSSEPLIVICAAGLDGSNADDVAKEIAIFRAHKAAPVVIASDGERRFDGACEVLFVPRVHPSLDFVVAAMAGHLFGYEAAVAIDAQARRLRELRGAVEERVAHTGGDDLLEQLAPALAGPAERFFADLREGVLDGHLEASTAVRLASLLHFARGSLPLDAYEAEYGKVGSPTALVEDLLNALSDAIDELTRPIDAIKHQAKTVTVGISRTEETYGGVPLVRAVLAAGVDRDRIGYRALRTLAELDPAVVAVTGYSRYEVEGDVAEGTARIARIDSGGIARNLPSRTDQDPVLRGTKRRAAFEREVTVSRSSHDGRTTVIVPETKDNQVTGITLLHVDLQGRLDPSTARRVLTGYRNRYNALVDAVTETEPVFRDEMLGQVDFVDLLVEPVYVLAGRWRQ